MTDDQVDAALQAEYLHLQKTIEDFDARALTIKAWSVTFGLVVFASALHHARAQRIEGHFRGDGSVEHPFQISGSWSASWKARRTPEIARIALWPHVALPHVVLVALGLLLFILSASGVVEP